MGKPADTIQAHSGEESRIRGRFLQGAAWMLLSKLGERGLGLLSTLILARLLLPADFGLVAMAAPVVALVELFGAWGMDAALIQRRDLERAHLDTAFTLGFIISIAIAAILWLIAPLAAAYFREPRLEAIINWLALGNLIQGFGNPGFILFRKEINMVPEVVVLLAKKLTSLLVAATAAILTESYWALVWGVLASRVVAVGLSYAMSSYRPRLSLAKRQDILGFSGWMLLIQILYYLQLRANDLLIGRMLGAERLAFFNVSIDLAASAPGEAMVAISRATFPAFAKLGSDTQRLRFGLRQVLAGVATFAIPAGFGIAATSGLMVRVLLGEPWMAAAEIVPAIAISAAVLGVMSQVSYVYIALGRPKVVATVSLLSVAILVVTSIIMIPRHGLAGVIVAYPAMAASIVFGHFFMLRRILQEFCLGDWLAAFWRPVSAASLMFVIVYLATGYVGTVSSSSAGVVPLTLIISMGVVVYVAAIFLLWRASGSPDGPEAMVWARFRSTFAGRFSK